MYNALFKRGFLIFQSIFDTYSVLFGVEIEAVPVSAIIAALLLISDNQIQNVDDV